MKPTKIYTGRSTIRMYLGDCMEFMKQAERYDLAIVDPPYGIGDKFKGGKTGKMNFNEIVNKDWDKAPNHEYFDLLQNVSYNQIIWGGNYFDLPPTRCFIVWDKRISEDFSLAMAELAWTNFDKLAKIYRLSVPKNGKQHPTQKPVQLYKWLLTNYAKEGDTILDTHGGSMSIAIACWDLGFDLDICELDTDYFNDALKRFEQHISQTQLF